MTDPNSPVVVKVANWPETPKPLLVKHTTLKTYVIDPAGTIGQGQTRWVQICDYEPKRVRLAIQVYDFAVSLCMEVPVNSPDTNAGVGTAPQGRLLAASTTFEYELYGPDAFYLNPVTGGAARVTVTREYC